MDQRKIAQSSESKDDASAKDISLFTKGWEKTWKLIPGRIKIDHSSTKRSIFKQKLEVIHTGSFRFTPIVINEGPLKGRRFLMFEPVKSTFPFMELPPELRKMVYTELLQDEKPIALVYDKFSRSGDRDKFKSLRRKKYINDGRPLHAPDAFASGRAIMSVSKLIHQEASAVGYGVNTFHFAAIPTFLRFLEDIGDMRQHLRHIELKLNDVALGSLHIIEILRYLEEAKGLRSIIINHDAVCGQLTQPPKLRKSFLNSMGSLLGVLQNASEDGKGLRGVLGRFTVASHLCFSCKNLEKIAEDPRSTPEEKGVAIERIGRCREPYRGCAGCALNISSPKPPPGVFPGDEHCKALTSKIREMLHKGFYHSGETVA